MPEKPKILTYLNYVMLAAFLMSAIVQYNDPDPLRWVAIYASATLVCTLYLLGRLTWGPPALVGGIAFVWAALLSPAVVGHVAIGDIFRSYEMKSMEVELAREMGGLLIVAVWMGSLTLLCYRQKSQ